MESRESLIEVDGVTKRWGSKLALDDISFIAESGAVTGFLGPNGAGKSTTLRILTTFVPPDRGDARVGGHSVTREPHRVQEKIGYLPEWMPVHPEMRVGEYLRYRAKLKGIARSGRRARVASVAERCVVDGVLHQRMSTLSRGFRQRVGIADALLTDPEVLILDEPTSGLDPVQVRDVRAVIEDLRQSHTVLLSSHILSEVEQLCDHIVIIAGGTIRCTRSRAEWQEELRTKERIVVTVPESDAESCRRTIERARGVLFHEMSRLGCAEGEVRFTLDIADGAQASIVRDFESASIDVGSVLPADPGLERIFLEAVRAGAPARQPEGAA